MKQRRRGPALTKAELRAQGDQAIAAGTKPIVKLPTKVVRKCGRCGEPSSVMVEPGQATPGFQCKSCDKPAQPG
jgi:DNA-directed RNA polymerase subunit RPC12/RpoP